MTTYVEVVRALVRAGYLSDADVDAATKALTYVLIMTTAAKKKKAVALADKAHQHEMIAQAADLITDDEVISDYEDEEVQIKTIEEAEELLTADEAAVTAAEATITGAFHDAAAALVMAGLIDAANVDAVVGVIKKVG
jgi:hypothetical protein